MADERAIWTREQDRAFEDALIAHFEEDKDCWDKIAIDVPGKTA
nr:transcription factor SRM1 [Tanacetum cinerariifolium]